VTTTAAPPGTGDQQRDEQRPARQDQQRISLRVRVTVLAAVCVAVAVGLVSLGVYYTVQRSLYNQVDANLVQRADNITQSSLVQVGGGTRLPAGLLAAAGLQLDLIDSTGRSRVEGLGTMEPPISGVERQVAAGQLDNQLRTDTRTDTQVYSENVGPDLALVIAQPLQPTQNVLRHLALVCILISVGGVLVAGAGGTLVARGTLGPVQRLTEATERIGKTGDLRPIPVTGDDELARLTQSFNAMLGALAESQEQQRRLVADAGHELRTPLTSLRTNLELLIESSKPGAPTLSDQDTSELYADVRGQLDELTQLIGDLTELARQDAPQVAHEPVELVDVLERALDRARRRATGVTFDTELHPWLLLGDASALERAVLNLLDNAVKFSPPDGVIRLSLRPAGDGTALVEVADQGPGIADADLPHVFERFYRSSEARTLPGSGLGLSIVAQAAQRHGGTVHAARRPAGGTLMTLRLPGKPG
jgi:two-component system, OmpR family, sensor histidine kinase MprB